MLSQKPWDELMVLRLLLALFISYAVISLMGGAVLNFLNPEAKSETMKIVAGSAAFHGSILAVILGFLRHYRISWRTAFGLDGWRNSRALLLTLITGAMALVIARGILSLCGKVLEWFQVESKMQMVVTIVQAETNLGHRICQALVAIVVAPLAEELLFRGIIYPTMKQSGYPRLALWTSALLFAAIHMNLVAFVPLTCLALIWTWLYERTGTLLAPILAHSLFNAVNFTLAISVPTVTRVLGLL